jgi:hypothetical protein
VLSSLLHSNGIAQAKISLELDTLANLLLVYAQESIKGNSYAFGLELPVLPNEHQQSGEGELIARVFNMHQILTC